MALRRRMLVTLLAWESVLLTFSIVAEKLNLSWHIHQLVCAVFGREDLYSFTNLVLHRVLAWLLYSTPAALMGIWLFGKLNRKTLDPSCRKCGYHLKGLPEPRCPECSEPI